MRPGSGRGRADTARVPRQFSYDDRPEAVHIPLGEAELEALILNGGKILHDDRKRIVHFLQRVSHTLRDQGHRVLQMQHTIEMLRSTKNSGGDPVRDALSALSKLDPSQEQEVLDRAYLGEIEKLRAAQEQAELVVLGADNHANRIRLALGAMLDDDTVPVDVKQRIRQALHDIG